MQACARCGAEFSCGMNADDGSPCWCMALPHLADMPPDAVPAGRPACWCPACLQQHIADRAAPPRP